MKLLDVDVSRMIPASAEEVYDVWLDPKNPASPWFSCERVLMNAVVDGLFYQLVQHEGRMWPHYGRFVALERGRRIEHTWMSEATRGLETTVTLTFEPRGGDGTLVKLRHAGLADDEMGRGHQEGWSSVLGEMAKRFAKRA